MAVNLSGEYNANHNVAFQHFSNLKKYWRYFLFIPEFNYRALVSKMMWRYVSRAVLIVLAICVMTSLVNGRIEYLSSMFALRTLWFTRGSFTRSLYVLQLELVCAGLSFAITYFVIILCGINNPIISFPLMVACDLPLISVFGLQGGYITAVTTMLLLAGSEDTLGSLFDRLYGIVIGLTSSIVVSLIYNPILHEKDIQEKLKQLEKALFSKTELCLASPALTNSLRTQIAELSQHIEDCLLDCSLFKAPKTAEKLLRARMDVSMLNRIYSMMVEIGYLSLRFNNLSSLEMRGVPINLIITELKQKKIPIVHFPKDAYGRVNTIISLFRSLFECVSMYCLRNEDEVEAAIAYTKGTLLDSPIEIPTSVPA